MGNICSKSANKPDNFQGAGRTLASTNATGASSAHRKTTQAVPSSVIASTPGRTLGGEQASGAPSNDPRSAAARAAEDRAKPKIGGKLSTQLAKDKSKTMNQQLNAASEAERGSRTQDENARNTAWN